MKKVISGAVAVLLALILGLAGCSRSVVTTPEYRNFAPPPITVTVEQLWADYTSDAAAADTRYKGDRLLFSKVEVEQVVGRDYTDRHGEVQYLVESLVAGSVKFELRDFNLQQNIEAGFVLNNVVGECRGLSGGFVVIGYSSVDSIQGDIGTIEEVSGY
jgi:hypothetical protein